MQQQNSPTSTKQNKYKSSPKSDKEHMPADQDYLNLINEKLAMIEEFEKLEKSLQEKKPILDESPEAETLYEKTQDMKFDKENFEFKIANSIEPQHRSIEKQEKEKIGLESECTFKPEICSGTKKILKQKKDFEPRIDKL